MAESKPWEEKGTEEIWETAQKVQSFSRGDSGFEVHWSKRLDTTSGTRMGAAAGEREISVQPT